MSKRLRAVLLGAASTVLMASAGHAADRLVAAPVGFNWSGFYIGVGGGFGASLFSSGGTGLGGQGLFGELTLGYDHMLTDRMLLGGFIDTHIGNMRFSQDFVATAPIAGSIRTELTNRYGFDAVARLGYLLNGNTLGYVLGGYTWERFNLKGSASVPVPVSVDENESHGGYVLGVGMETAIGRNWTIKAEYRYSNYGDIALGGSLGAGVSPSTHTFHIAANYRFGAWYGSAPAVPSPAYDWTGFYVGAGVGAGEALYQLSATATVPAVGHEDTDGVGTDGVFGELDAGYDHDFGKFVAGVMVDGFVSDIGGSDVKMDYGFDVLGRVGMKVNPSTLAYVLGGYSWGHFKADDIGPGGRVDWGASGFSVGSGLETAISTHTTLGIEYRYAQFGEKDVNAILGPGSTGTIQPSSHTVRVGLKYKFN